MLGFVRLWSAFEVKRANDLPIGWQIPVTLITSISDTIVNRFNVPCEYDFYFVIITLVTGISV